MEGIAATLCVVAVVTNIITAFLLLSVRDHYASATRFHQLCIMVLKRYNLSKGRKR